MLNSIRTKILMLFFVGMVLVVGVLITFTLGQVDKHYTDLFLQRGEIAAQELARRAERLIGLGLLPDEFLGFDGQCREVVESTPGVNFAALLDKSGNVLYHSGDSVAGSEMIDESNPALMEKQSLQFASLDLGSYVLVTVDEEEVNAQVGQLVNKILIMGVVLTILGSVIMVVFLRVNFLLPVRILLHHIKTMKPDRKRELPRELVSRGDEIGTIATAFDQLSDRVAASQYDMLNHTYTLEKIVKERTQELRIANEGLQRLALTDTLTGLPNRLAFMNMLHQSLAQAVRHDHTLAVYLLDLNGFKQINDRHGHAAGDYVLKSIAERVKNRIREGDTFSRLGGDEFALLIAEFSKDTNLHQIADKIIDLVSEPLAWQSAEFAVSASIGIAIFNPASNQSADDLLGVADAAMYEAKRRGVGYKFAIRSLSVDQSS